MNRNAVLGLFASVALSACTGTGTTVTVPLPPTSIVVDPAEFLGDVPCFPTFGEASVPSGAMRRYVATLISVEAGGALDAEVALPSSPPTRCSDPVSFQRVVDGTAYVAEIDGYDVDGIHPLGEGGIFGSRVMVDDHNRFVPPRWQPTCGKTAPSPPPPGDASTDGSTSDAADATPTGPRDAALQSLDTGVAPYRRCTGRALEAGKPPDLEGPACAIANIAIPIRGCAPLREVNPPKNETTAITVDLAGVTLPDGDQCLGCGPGVGQIAHFRVELDGSSEPPRTAACKDPISFVLPAGKLATFTVTAYGAGASPGANACRTADGGAGAPLDAGVLDGSVTGDAGVCGRERQVDNGNAGIWCTRCFGQTLPGVSLPATCDPLAATQRRPY